MAKFHTLSIADIYKETKDCSVITFDVPEALQSEFQYKQGQYLTLRTELGGKEVRRSYSLCSSPIDNKWQVAVKQINGGLFSTFANNYITTFQPHGFTVGNPNYAI